MFLPWRSQDVGNDGHPLATYGYYARNQQPRLSNPHAICRFVGQVAGFPYVSVYSFPSEKTMATYWHAFLHVGQIQNGTQLARVTRVARSWGTEAKLRRSVHNLPSLA